MVRVYPLPHLPVIKDLVLDLSHFYAQYASIEPWLKTVTPTPEKEWKQTPADRAKIDETLRMHSLRLLQHRLSQLLVDQRALPLAGRPAAGAPLDHGQPRRGKRRDNLDDRFRLYRCHTILNCAKACPKGLNPAKAIAEIKKMLVERQM